jgi:hypothetical protein
LDVGYAIYSGFTLIVKLTAHLLGLSNLVEEARVFCLLSLLSFVDDIFKNVSFFF